jgi:hypothetical protein
MKIYSVYTDEVSEIKQIFLDTMKDDWEVNLTYLGKAGEGDGNFLSSGWIDVRKKTLDLQINSIKENLEDVIIWSDLDIQFFAECTPLIMQAMEGNDIVFQAERWPEKDEVNMGFVVIRCNDRTLGLYQMASQYDLDNLQVADQTAINDILLKKSADVKWDILPNQFWAMSHYMHNQAVPPADIVLHHANCTNPTAVNGKTIGSIELKIQQFQLIRDYINAKAK